MLTFVEPVKFAFNQYKTAYVELAFALSNAVAFSSIYKESHR